ncbi:MAG TPA: hypothetical protein PLG72_08830 [Clostridiales bacterium]|nr:hypothetical protein [Clostridiales bacterium]
MAMAALISIGKFFAKLILFVIFSPVIFTWMLFRCLRCRTVLVRNMVQAGMPREYALELAREIRISRMLGFSMDGKGHKPD